MKKIILLASIVYFLLAPISYHPDTKLTLRYPALENSSVWDIYSYLDSHNLDIPDFHYPPAHFWWLKLHYPISKIIAGNGFDKWLDLDSVNSNFDNNSFRYNLAVKFPLLVLGLLSGYVIFLIVKKWSGNEVKARYATLFWYFNPVTIYSLVMMGQNDIVAIFLFLLGILFFEKSFLSIILWGIAAGVKNYPLIWSIVFLLACEKNIFQTIKKTAGVISVYGLILLPWIGKTYFTEAVLNSGLSQRMFIANLPIGFDKLILIVPTLLVLIAFKFFVNKDNKKNIAYGSLAIFQSSLVILGFSHFNPQWMLWTVPFIAIWGALLGVRKVDLLIWFFVFISWLGLILGFNDRFLTWGIITPLNPNLINYPSFVELLNNRGVEFSQFINYFQSILAGLSLFYLFSKFKKPFVKLADFKISRYLILIPWIFFLIVLILIPLIEVDKRKESGSGENKIYFSELTKKVYKYNTENSLKYFEISLDNPNLNSEDRGTLFVSDDIGSTFEKEISGFNAEANSWLRVDVPKSMSNSKEISLELKNIITKDGFLKIKLDDQNRWKVVFYNSGKESYQNILMKIGGFWWWWLLLIAASAYYFRLDSKKQFSK
ncbi:MAG TPA: glycosyltransferase 87 family protein [Candidatus Methanoperedens sp.]|nr:glycosyltransferase 87 family protein [Candidatus Methanoperedens sp.]